MREQIFKINITNVLNKYSKGLQYCVMLYSLSKLWPKLIAFIVGNSKENIKFI